MNKLNLNILRALFTQQRLQILQLGQDKNAFSNAYFFAWDNSVYPYLDDRSDDEQFSVYEYHKPYEEIFQTSKKQVKEIFHYLCDLWDSNQKLTFYELEDYLDNFIEKYDRGDLINICRYLYLSDRFDKDFWEHLVLPMQHPCEAQSIIDDFDRNFIYYQ